MSSNYISDDNYVYEGISLDDLPLNDVIEAQNIIGLSKNKFIKLLCASGVNIGFMSKTWRKASPNCVSFILVAEDKKKIYSTLYDYVFQQIVLTKKKVPIYLTYKDKCSVPSLFVEPEDADYSNDYYLFVTIDNINGNNKALRALNQLARYMPTMIFSDFEETYIKCSVPNASVMHRPELNNLTIRNDVLSYLVRVNIENNVIRNTEYTMPRDMVSDFIYQLIGNAIEYSRNNIDNAYINDDDANADNASSRSHDVADKMIERMNIAYSVDSEAAHLAYAVMYDLFDYYDALSYAEPPLTRQEIREKIMETMCHYDKANELLFDYSVLVFSALKDNGFFEELMVLDRQNKEKFTIKVEDPYALSNEYLHKKLFIETKKSLKENGGIVIPLNAYLSGVPIQDLIEEDTIY